jgi:hypothetical protein
MTEEPVREVVLLFTVRRAQAFAEKVAALQQAWGTQTVVETVERAVDEAAARR